MHHTPRGSIEHTKENAMNTMIEVKTNPNPAPESRSVAGGAAAATASRSEKP
jgi:hypothetical protein